MRYEIRKSGKDYVLHRIGTLGDRDVLEAWNDVIGRWGVVETCFHSLAAAKAVVCSHEFYPCVVVEQELTKPMPQTTSLAPEVPTLTFSDLERGEKFIFFRGSDGSKHYVFLKTDETEATNLAYGNKRPDIEKNNKVIRVTY